MELINISFCNNTSFFLVVCKKKDCSKINTENKHIRLLSIAVHNDRIKGNIQDSKIDFSTQNNISKRSSAFDNCERKIIPN